MRSEPRGEKQYHRDHREGDRQDQATLDATGHPSRIPGADCLRDDRIEREQHALPEDGHDEEVQIADRDSREVPQPRPVRP